MPFATGFQESVRADPAVSPALQVQIQKSTEEGLPTVSSSQVRLAAEQAGLAPAEVQALVGHYSDAQIQALKRALFFASMFALVGLWFARDLPGEPLPTERDDARAAPARPPPQPVPSV